MPDNTNAKPAGMKASLSAEDIAALQPAPQIGEQVKTEIERVVEAHPPASNETSETGTLNVADVAYVPFADEASELLFNDLEPQRRQFLIEVLHNYRQQLTALIARQEIVPANSYGGASLLNPTPLDTGADRVISAAERGVAKCNQLMRELGVTEGV